MLRNRMIAAAILPVATVSTAVSAPQLSPIFQSGMVLQQGNATRIFGMADPGERLEITVGPSHARTVADRTGRFDIRMRMPKAGGPYTVEVKGSSGATQRLDDVLVGEVWFCSGQSNMEWEANYFSGRTFDLGPSNFPGIRLFKHTKRVSTQPQHDALGTWVTSNPVNSRQFSLVGYLFGRQLHQRLGVPVGLIDSAWGGTPAESWIDIDSLRARPLFAGLADKYKAASQASGPAKAAYDAAIEKWALQTFPETAVVSDTINWGKMRIPGTIEQSGPAMDGIFWVRQTFEVPAAWAGKDLTLELGAIDDYDATYVNGKRVGWTGPNTPNAYAAPRKYTIPASVLHAGTNEILVKVIDTGGEGGFTGAPGEVRVGTGGSWVQLAGTWGYKFAADFSNAAVRASVAPPAAPVGIDDPWLPSGLYNGMVTSVAPFSIKGAIWYQGESNVGRAKEYSVLFPDMIQSWRKVWANPDLAFHFVQLSAYGTPGDSTTESGWADLREAQTAALKLKGVGMAVAVDAGEEKDIHPFRKDVVADRLARAALARTYGKRVEFEGPAPTKVERRGDALRISLAHAKGLTTLDKQAPRGFAIAGADGKWYVADALFDGETLVLRSSRVPTPVAARYAWADYIAANVGNAEGLAMPPFRVRLP